MRNVDVAVVGAGPAGVSAALTVARNGANVALLDETGAAGGWLRWSIAEQQSLGGDLAARRGHDIADWTARELADAGIPIIDGVAWGLFEDNVLGVVAGGASYQLRGAAVILATGSTDVTLPFPGWELPGVMTARAMLRFLHEHRVLPASRVAAVGAGALADETREALGLAGIQLVVAVDAPAELIAGGDGRVEWVESGGVRSPADGVVIALGRQPDPELALQALAEFGFSHVDQAFVPLRDASLQTSVPGVYVVGDAAGACTTAEAFAEGRLAAAAATGGNVRAAADELRALRTEARQADIERLRLPVTAGV